MKQEEEDEYEYNWRDTYSGPDKRKKEKVINQAPVVSPLLKEAIAFARSGEFSALISQLGNSYLQQQNWFDQDENGNTILIVLASTLSSPLVSRNNNASLMTCVKLILAKQDKETIGAKVNIKNKAGDSAIILAGKGAAENNDITKQFIDAIVEKGAYIFDSNTNTQNTEYGKTALMHATRNEDLKNYILLNELIVLANNLNRPQRIVKDTSNVDAFTDKLTQLPKNLWFNQNVFGETILIRLADKGNPVLVNTLLDGATKIQVDTRNKNGNSAIILTGRSDQSYNKETKQIIDALIAKGAGINDINNPDPGKHQGQTAYMLALDNNNEDLYNYIAGIRNAKNNAITQRGGKRTAKKYRKSRKMRKRKSRKTRRVR